VLSRKLAAQRSSLFVNLNLKWIMSNPFGREMQEDHAGGVYFPQ
jgi:hypothetical protein